MLVKAFLYFLIESLLPDYKVLVHFVLLGPVSYHGVRDVDAYFTLDYHIKVFALIPVFKNISLF